MELRRKIFFFFNFRELGHQQYNVVLRKPIGDIGGNTSDSLHLRQISLLRFIVPLIYFDLLQKYLLLEIHGGELQWREMGK